MKLSRRTLRKMILKEVRNLQEGRYASSGPNLYQLFGPMGWGRRGDWNFVTHASIQRTMQMSGMDAHEFYETVKKIAERNGTTWQLPKVAEALSEADPSFYDYASQELGTQLYHDTDSKIKLPKLTSSTPMLDDDDDYDPNY